MKKVLSIMLALCLLLTMFIIPVAAEEVDVNAGKLYYKFDFSEDTLYTDYQNPVLPEGVTYDSFAAANTIGTNVFEYGKIGDKDGLYIRSGGASHNVVFTPLKEDGTPIVLEAGKQYIVEWDFVVTRGAGAWARPHIEPYTTLSGASSNGGDRYAAYYTPTNGTKTYLTWKEKGKTLGYSSLFAGSELKYWNAGKDFVSSASDDVVLDAYQKVTETVEGAEGEEPTTKVSFRLLEDAQYDNGVSATGVAYSFQQTVSIASDAEMEETYGIVKNEDGSYSFNGNAYNNFLGLSLPGGYGTYYYPGKDEKSIDNVQDAEGNWYHRAYAEYYVTGLRVYDAECEFATVTCVNGDNVTVVNTVSGEKIDYPANPVNHNGETCWSLSATEYVPVPTVAPAEDITVYAYCNGVVSFENYGNGDNSYVINQWLTNAMITSEKAYSGEKSMKYHNYNLNVIDSKPSDWEENWNKYYSYDAENDTFALLTSDTAPAFEAGKYYRARYATSLEQGAFLIADLGSSKNAYGEVNVYNYTRKVSFKYFVPEGNTKSFTIKAVQYNKTSIWVATPATVGAQVDIPATPTGEWKTFEMIIKADDLAAVGAGTSGNQVIALQVGTSTIEANGRDATIYIDDVTVEDVQVVTFEIPEGATVKSEGEVVDGILTIYIKKGGVAEAPVVIGANGNPIDVWYDMDGNEVTEFVAGAYTSQPFIYGDCNDDGKITTTDLAALKLKLAGSGEVGLGADCNGDGAINTTDLAALKLNLAGSGTLGPAE